MTRSTRTVEESTAHLPAEEEITALEEALGSAYQKIEEHRRPEDGSTASSAEVVERFRPRADGGVTW